VVLFCGAIIDYTQKVSSVASDLESETQAREQLAARVAQDITAAIQTEGNARAEADSAFASWATTLDSRVGEDSDAKDADGSLYARLKNEANVRATADAAEAQARQTLATRVGDNAAAIQEEASVRIDAVETLEAKYGVRLDVNGRVTGFVQNNDGKQGNFIIMADKFLVVPVGSNSTSGTLLFDTQSGTLHLKNINVDWGLIKNAKIETAQIVDGAITSAKIKDGEITSAKIGEGTIETAHIGKLKVSTLMIDEDAVTVPHFIDGTKAKTLIGNGGWQNYLNESLPNVEEKKPILMIGTFGFSRTGRDEGLRIYMEGFTKNLVLSEHSQRIVLYPPKSGTLTFYLQGKCISGYSSTASWKDLLFLHIKR
jgi:hypothetical protein